MGSVLVLHDVGARFRRGRRIESFAIEVPSGKRQRLADQTGSGHTLNGPIRPIDAIADALCLVEIAAQIQHLLVGRQSRRRQTDLLPQNESLPGAVEDPDRAGLRRGRSRLLPGEMSAVWPVSCRAPHLIGHGDDAGENGQNAPAGSTEPVWLHGIWNIAMQDPDQWPERLVLP